MVNPAVVLVAGGLIGAGAFSGPAAPGPSAPSVDASASAAPGPSAPSVDASTPAAGPSAPSVDASASAAPGPSAPSVSAPAPAPFAEVHGYAQLWATAGQHDSRIDAGALDWGDGFRIRRAHLQAAHHSGPFAAALVGAFENSITLLEAKGSYRASPALQLTGGQFKVPFGASALQSGAELTMIDRAVFVTKMLKSTFRDIGLMVHSDAGGLFGGSFGYMVGAFNGGGINGLFRDDDDRTLLVSGRLVAGLPRGATLGGISVGAGLGLSAATSRYPNATDSATSGTAVDGDKLAQILANRLGGKLGFADQGYRVTAYGADLHLALAGASLVAEGIYERFTGDRHDEKTAYGYSTELGYWVLPGVLEAVARYDGFVPDTSRNGAESKRQDAFSAGVSFTPDRHVEVALNGYLLKEGNAVYSAGGVPAGEIRNDLVRLQVQYAF